MSRIVFIFPFLALISPTTNAALIYEMNETASFNHVTNVNDFGSSNPPTPGSSVLSVGTFNWGSLSTDSTANTATFTGTDFAATDWGGLGRYTSTNIDLSGFSSFEIDYVGASSVNVAGEFFNFFYILDGAKTTFGSVMGLNPAGEIESGTPSGMLTLSVGGASTLSVGFEFSHDGSTDSASVSQLRVSATAVPEPSSFAFVGLALSGVVYIRNRRITVK